MAHAVGVSVEGELGCLGSLETGEAGEEDGVGAEGKLSHDRLLTDPAQAKDFVARTGVDALAIAMHGSSSVPQEWLLIIRQYGGDIKETYGVPVEEVQRGIRSGVRKINIDTDIRLAMTGAMRQLMTEQRSEFDLRKALAAARRAARGICKARFEAFGCAGNASRIKPQPLEALAARYR
jgi:fructose-bisphosphate aldolase class II